MINKSCRAILKRLFYHLKMYYIANFSTGANNLFFKYFERGINHMLHDVMILLNKTIQHNWLQGFADITDISTKMTFKIQQKKSNTSIHI